MKILEQPPVVYTTTYTCRVCSSRLEADLTDLKIGEFGGNYHEDGTNQYYIECPVCKDNRIIPSKELSYMVKQTVNKRCRKEVYL